ncbi:response regulator [Cohnella herbarum]|uniref:Response regulator n=1 Tax=Cohnella herbarum TaxID=2728023 RepID=A0A7Z2VPQ1_9BACL|nr:response regulator [Cohnella herbarum]QJD86815.1 response regulator [Cohnella herbarum]
MYGLLIVEDEDIIRAGIKKIIQEMELSIGTVFEASSGKEALEIISRQDVHMIVTDIKMDDGDGLELIRALPHARLRAKTIILSGYGQFAYAQQAISLGVSDYLLKPIKKKNLHEALTKLISQLDSEQPNPSAANRPAERRESPGERMLREIARGSHTVSDIESLLSSARIPTGSRYRLAVTVHVGSNGSDVSELIERIDETNRQTYRVLAACESEPGHVLLLIGSDDAAWLAGRQLHSALQGLIAEADLSGSPIATIGISEYSDRTEDLQRLIKQSAYALDFRLLRPAVRHFYYKETVPHAPPSQAPNVFLQTVRSSLHDGNPRALAEALDGWFRFVRQQTDVTPSFVADTLYNLLVYSEFTGAKEQDWNSRTHSDLTRMYRGSVDLDEFKALVKQRFAEVLRATSTNRSVAYDSNAISFTIKYLEHHYDQDITLRSAADRIFMNPSYFSTLFKKKTGISFVHYVQKLRIEKSKALLQDPQYKIYEVATKIGFSDEKYFFKVFKNLTGITPNEYRDKREFA